MSEMPFIGRMPVYIATLVVFVFLQFTVIYTKAFGMLMALLDGILRISYACHRRSHHRRHVQAKQTGLWSRNLRDRLCAGSSLWPFGETSPYLPIDSREHSLTILKVGGFAAESKG
jgi:hypothetical protein